MATLQGGVQVNIFYKLTAIIALFTTARVYFTGAQASMLHIGLAIYSVPLLVKILNLNWDFQNKEGQGKENKPKSWCD